jgi:prevent-host-death family protein
VPVTQARAELSELVNRVVYGRERIVLTRHGRAVAAIVSAEDLHVLVHSSADAAITEGAQVEQVPSSLGGPESAPHLAPAAEWQPVGERPQEFGDRLR